MGAVTRTSILLCVAVAAFCVAMAPVLDEESYLAITANLDPLRPYHWWRPWPPWYGGSEPDAFVYAHPPLFLTWVSVVQDWADGLLGTRWAAGLPFAVLLGWAGGRLIESTSRRPRLALALWLSSPIVFLGLQRGLMPDLMVAALCTTSVLGWRERSNASLQWVGGAALGLAAFAKYPALALVPVFLVHGYLTQTLRGRARFWLAAAAPWFAGELWLTAIYGRFHLVEVLGRASEISRGTGEGRAMAVVARLVLGVSVLGLFARGARWVWAPAVVLGGAVCLWAWPSDVSLAQRGFLLLFAVIGAAVLMPAVHTLVSRAKGESVNGDRLLFALWALAVIGGVWGVHNFAAPRYLLAAVLPLALLVLMEAGDRPQARFLMWAGAGIQLVLAVSVTVAEHRFFEAGADVARAAIVQFQPTHYTGEWSFRHEMDAAGVTFFAGEAPSGSIIAGPIHSSPGALPAGLEEVGRVTADESLGLRLVAESAQIGMYAETLGALPVGWSSEPLEEVILWRVP